jgi:hypothetical protein
MERTAMTRSTLNSVAAIGAVVGATWCAAAKGIDPAPAPGVLSMRIPNEAAPAGAMVQMKVMTTEVTPISGGRPTFGYDASFFDAAAGFAIAAPNGEAAGAAIVEGAHVQVIYRGTSRFTADYPVMTVVLPIRADVARGTRTRFTLDPSSTWDFGAAGPTTAVVSSGTVRVEGTTSIADVIPGEGVWPAGTVVRVLGTGFDARTSLKVNGASIAASRFESPTEMQFVLARSTDVRGLRITASGATNSVTYYAYMRGITSQRSSRALLATTEPIFTVAQRTRATLAPTLSMSGSQYEAVALQNPTLGGVSVRVSLHAANGTVIHEAVRTLAARERLVLEASEMLDGIAPPVGSTIVVTASAAIDVFSLLCDEGLSTVLPVLPLEAQ